MARNRVWGSRQVSRDDFLRRPGKRWRPGEELVGQRSERVDIGAVVDGSRGDLLGRHIGWRANHRPRPRHRQVYGVGGERPRYPEVGKEDVAVGDQHVVRLDIAMNHAPGVGVRQRVRQLAEDPHDLPDRQPAVRLSRARRDSPSMNGMT